MSGTLKTYDAVINGHRTRIKLTVDEAKKRGLTEAKAERTATTKKRTARNKADDAADTTDA